MVSAYYMIGYEKEKDTWDYWRLKIINQGEGLRLMIFL